MHIWSHFFSSHNLTLHHPTIVFLFFSVLQKHRLLVFVSTKLCSFRQNPLFSLPPDSSPVVSAARGWWLSCLQRASDIITEWKTAQKNHCIVRSLFKNPLSSGLLLRSELLFRAGVRELHAGTGHLGSSALGQLRCLYDGAQAEAS